MEIFGTQNNTDNMIDVKELLTRIMSLNTLQQNDVNDSIQVLCYAIDKMCDNHDDISALVMALDSNEQIAAVPILRNLVTEYKLKFIRTTVFSPADGTSAACNQRKLKVGDESKERERFVPTPVDNFELPGPGTTGNLTVTAPDRITGKTCIRELIIDSEGYVVTELSRRYTDINTDESEEIFTEAYLKQLEEAKNK